MILDKFRNRYSFNFLSICGWICFIAVILCVSKEIYIIHILKNTQYLWGVYVYYIGISFFAILSLFITSLIYFFEKIFNIKMKNYEILNNKIIHIVQILGIIFELVIILALCLILIYAIIN